jgi:hypothetical protein
MILTLNRGEKTAIPFVINDSGNGLLAMRVTWSVSALAGGSRNLRKVGGLPGSSADISITSQSASNITGSINIKSTDFLALPASAYVATLWIDDGLGGDRCVTAGGIDTLKINGDVARA